MYGIEWDRAPLMTNGAALKAVAALTGSSGGVGGKELETMWRKGPFVKLSPGEYTHKRPLPSGALASGGLESFFNLYYLLFLVA